MSGHLDRRQRLLAGCMLAVLGLLVAIYFGYGARDRALDRAADQARGALASGLDGSALRGSIQARVARWVAGPGADAAYLSVSVPGRGLVASAGRWSHWLSGWLSPGAAHRWQARLYRSLCAEGRRPLARPQNAEPATLRLGVPWWQVLAGAGTAFWLALLLGLLGMALAVRERFRAEIVEDASAVGTTTADRRPDRVSMAWPALARRWRAPSFRSRAASGAGRSTGEFEPIARANVAGPSVVAERGAPTVETKASTMAEPSCPPPASAEPELAESTIDESTAVPEPMFRFLPLWRGAADGLLAGAFVTLARPDSQAESPWISIEQLAASGRDEAERNALTRWLAQRLVTFQANWHSLELPRVPLFVVVPPALFDFDAAERAWGQALKGFEQAAEDIVLCVERLPEAIRHALPVRWAVAESEPGQACRYRLILPDTADAAMLGEIDTIRLPKPDEPSPDSARRPLPPREFARLLSERELAPL